LYCQQFYDQSEDSFSPTDLQLIDDSRGKCKNRGPFNHWTGFAGLFETGAVDYEYTALIPKMITASLGPRAYIKDKKPTFTFIHLIYVDHGGHEYGHGSP